MMLPQRSIEHHATGLSEMLAVKTAVEVPGLSLFCFSVYTEKTGSDKISHELELL